MNIPMRMKIFYAIGILKAATVKEISKDTGHDNTWVHRGIKELQSLRLVYIKSYRIVKAQKFALEAVFAIGKKRDAVKPKLGMPEYERLKDEHFEMMQDVDPDWTDQKKQNAPDSVLEVDQIFRRATMQSVQKVSI